VRKRLSVHRPVWPQYREGAHEPPAWAGKVRSWCVVREAVDTSTLEGFDLIVVTEPRRALDTWLGHDDLDRLRSRSIRLVAHVPLVRPVSLASPLLAALGRTGLSAEPWYIDAVGRIRASALLSWDGYYLDDMAEVVAKPGGREAALELISIARAAGRGGIVIVQSVSDDAVTEAGDLVGAESPLA
jgi:hypothetical protein